MKLVPIGGPREASPARTRKRLNSESAEATGVGSKGASEPVDFVPESQRLAAEPQRPSEPVRAWRADYEKSLGLAPRLLKLRTGALQEGGASMLYRMYPLLFQQDLAGPYQSMSRLLPEPGPRIKLAGDCHLANFGTLRNGNEEVLWTVNDYDQVGKGPVESDLCRAAASLALLAHERGWSKKVGRELVESFLSRYSRGVSDFARQPPEGALGIRSKDSHAPVTRLIEKAEDRKQSELLAKWAEPDGDSYRFQMGEELHVLEPEQSRRLDQLLEQARFPANVKVLDRCCRWDAGGSSLGLERYYVLVEKEGEPLPTLVELKQVLPCALAGSDPDPRQTDPALLRDGFKWMSAPRDQWRRVLSADDGVYLVRERQSARDALKPEELTSEQASKVARQMGKVLAQAHAFAGGAPKIQAWIDGNEDELTENLWDFSQAYARQMREDFQELFRS